MDFRHETPTFSELLRQRHMEKHRRNLNRVRSMIDQTAPTAIAIGRKLHSTNPKKKTMLKQRQKEIDRENSKLVSEVTRILTRRLPSEKATSTQTKATVQRLRERKQRQRELTEKKRMQKNKVMTRKLTAQSSTIQEALRPLKSPIRSPSRRSRQYSASSNMQQQSQFDSNKKLGNIVQDSTLLILDPEPDSTRISAPNKTNNRDSTRRRSSRRHSSQRCASSFTTRRTLSTFWKQLNHFQNDEGGVHREHKPQPPTRSRETFRNPARTRHLHHIQPNTSKRKCTLSFPGPLLAIGSVDIPVIDSVPRVLAENFEHVTWRSDLHQTNLYDPSDDAVVVVIGHFATHVEISLVEGNTNMGTASKLEVRGSRHGGKTTFPIIEALPSELMELFGVAELDLHQNSFKVVAHLVAKFLWYFVERLDTADGMQVPQTSSTKVKCTKNNNCFQYDTRLLLFPSNHLTSVAHEVRQRRASNDVLDNRLVAVLTHDNHDDVHRDSEDIVDAAVRVQAVFRSHRARKEQKEVVAACLKIQCAFRACTARNVAATSKLTQQTEMLLLLEKQKHAVVRIQSLWRGSESRAKSSMLLKTTQLKFPCGIVAKVCAYARGVHVFISATCVDTGSHGEMIFPGSGIAMLQTNVQENETLSQERRLAASSSHELGKYVDQIFSSLRWRNGHCTTLSIVYSTLTKPLDESWKTVTKFATRAKGSQAPLLVVLFQVEVHQRRHPGVFNTHVADRTEKFFVFQLFDPATSECVWYQLSNLIDLRTLCDTLLPLQESHEDIYGIVRESFD